MRPSTVQMLLRTLFTPTETPSVRNLHRTAGLRVALRSESERANFAKLFAEALTAHLDRRRRELMAVFDNPPAAEDGIARLVEAGIDRKAISILYRAGQFVQANHDYPAGHSKASVVLATAGGGVAGALLGVTMLTVPGLGVLAAGGALATSAISTMSAFGGAMGATGGAVARMLTDFDVSDREASYFDMAVREGKVFLAIDPRFQSVEAVIIRHIFAEAGGKMSE